MQSVEALSVQRYKVKPKKRFSPPQVLAVGFLLIILTGTLLLMLPISSENGESVGFSTAVFTATSATCVTGLVVTDTAASWSVFGQSVILVLIQVGGLGFMSVAVLMSRLLRRTITPRENRIVAESLGLSSAEGASGGFAGRLLAGTFIMEGCGALLLSFRFVPLFGWKNGIYRSIFHAVSAFCNAGFDIMGSFRGGSSMSAFASDPLVTGTLSVLIIMGGIGYVVWLDLFDLIVSRVRHLRAKRSRLAGDMNGRVDRLGVYSRMVLIMTGLLLAGGFLLTLLLEWNGALSGLTVGGKLNAAFFHSVSLRTAGFAAFDNAAMSDAGKGVSVFLMMIGGASGSTAGGLKVATVGLLFYSEIQIALGREEIVLMKRTISKDTVLRAMALCMIGLVIVGSSTVLISVFCSAPMLTALYETASAYATVGLSLNFTGGLNLFGRFWVMLLMYMGRVGILTITYSLALKRATGGEVLRHPQTPFMVG